ncbi:MAG: hypothetical protein WC050_02515, partial [Candidatus Paceibacterota bacterium]
DIITAIYLFEYFPKLSDIENMVKQIKSVMKRGSVFYGLTIDQAAVASKKDYYGIQGDLPREEGQEFADSLPDGEGNTFSVHMYYWTMDSLRRVFEDNGLRFKELPVAVAQEGIEKYGNEYWNLFFERPIYRIFKVTLQ